MSKIAGAGYSRHDSGWFDREVLPRLTLDTAYPDIEWTSRRGREWRARCPIHGGGNPESFCANVETLVSYCHACGHSGGPLAYWWAMTHEPTTRPRGRDAWVGMVELAERVGVSPPGGGDRESVWERNPLPRPQRVAPEPPEYPPTPEVWALWRMGERPSSGAAATLEAWGVDPASVDDECRVLPRGITWTPSWARTRGCRWGIAGYEILVPLRDASMRPMSYVARSLAPEPGAPKTGCPAGYTTRGLVMANAAARQAIVTGHCSWGSCVVREGERDWLFDAQHGAPVIGTRSGAWTDDMTRALPHGWTLEIATDDDPKGDELAGLIVDSLGRCEREDIWWTRTKRAEAK